MPTNPTTSRPAQPCTDDRCPVHARGADPARVSPLTCARQVLRAYDRADAVALLEQEPPLRDPGERRVLLQLRPSSPLSAGQSETLVLREVPQGRRIHHFRAGRILLRGDPSWRVDDVVMGGRSQIHPHGRLPSEMFDARIAGVGLCVFDRIAQPLHVEVSVTRVDAERPDVMIGAIVGWATYEPRSIPLRSDALAGSGSRSTVQVDQECAQPVEVHQLVIEDGGDWIVHDVEVDGRSCFAQAGDVPGDVFAPGALDSFVKFGVVRAGATVRVYATYIGDDPEGRRLVGEFRGQEPEDPEAAEAPVLEEIIGLT